MADPDWVRSFHEVPAAEHEQGPAVREQAFQSLPSPAPITFNKSKIQISVDKKAVENIALCFAQAQMVDVELVPGIFSEPQPKFHRRMTCDFPPGQWGVVTNGLYKIGKKDLPAGIIAIIKCPKMTRHDAGGNDQLQRGAKLCGAARGSATCCNSKYATPAYVAITQSVYRGAIHWITRTKNDEVPSAPQTG